MKQTLRRWATAAAGAAIALFAASCAYDPYYSETSIGYGDGYGYGHSSFSTSVFVSTGSSRWGYDPHVNCYYDYNRRAYYDPFLYGYYPVGYRPPYIHGAPRPHGWRNNYCPPPSRIRNTTLSGYRDRESLYRRSNHSWSKQIRGASRGSQFQPRPDNRPRVDQSRPNARPTPAFGQGGRGRQGSPPLARPDSRTDTRSNRNFTPPQRRETVPNRTPGFDRNSNRGIDRPSPPQRTREIQRQPSRNFNRPVNTPPQRVDRGAARSPQAEQRRSVETRPAPQARPPAPQARPSPSGNGERRSSSRSDGGGQRGRR